MCSNLEIAANFKYRCAKTNEYFQINWRLTHLSGRMPDEFGIVCDIVIHFIKRKDIYCGFKTRQLLYNKKKLHYILLEPCCFHSISNIIPDYTYRNDEVYLQYIRQIIPWNAHQNFYVECNDIVRLAIINMHIAITIYT